MDEANNQHKSELIRVCVDAIVDMGAGQILLINRKHAPEGWALPGGFVEAGENAEEAVIREVREETGLDVEIVKQFHTYTNPNRDPRGPSISVVFLTKGYGEPAKTTDETAGAELFHQMNLPENLAFDHRQILSDYFLERY
ncbi:NUDIX hydrolase [bacterium]|nr:NUDIX hydrolase [bacterium]